MAAASLGPLSHNAQLNTKAQLQPAAERSNAHSVDFVLLVGKDGDIGQHIALAHLVIIQE